MSDQPTFNRRRVLELSGVGTALAVAGCTSQLDDGLEGDRGELEDGERRATMVIEPDQEAAQELEMEIQQQVQAGELDQQEAQVEFQERQTELLEAALENVQAEFEAFDLTIEDSLQDQILLVAGPATDLIDAVDVEGIGGLLGSDAFEQTREQQEAQEEQVPEEPPEDEDGDEPTQEELEEEIQEELEEAEAEEEDDE